MFRRTKTETVSSADHADLKEGGKGRPTPSRRAAQAAAKARAKAPRDKKAASKLLRERRSADNAKVRQGMKSGDERYLPARDQGKLRRFVRDRIDSRICMAEFLLILLLAVMALTSTGNETLRSYGNGLWTATVFLVVTDTGYLIFKLKRELKQRFPDEPHKGAVFYAILRSLQIRFLRLPKPKVKLGQKLPAHY
ncbi:MAG TPA: DUF3043 domain-containing protein [Actinomycetota bacterium]|nr:DUF3043 domain-containing protein [Actinomycetota bacterium]